jgi:hypothetical protein
MNVAKKTSDNRISFFCPGCDGYHEIAHGVGNGPRWTWNGDLVKPTFTPSVLVTYPANPNADEDFKEWRNQRICHSFVTDGKIQFLSDCTHQLAGKTVDLPEWDNP